jgi:hypothetical protein
MPPKITASVAIMILVILSMTFTLSPARTSDAGSDIIKASTIIGARIQSPERNDIGEVKDLAIDERTGEMIYAVRLFEGVLGIGEKYSAVPWDALDPIDDAECFLLNLKKSGLSNALGFDKDNGPDFADPENCLRIYEYDELPPRTPRTTAGQAGQGRELPLHSSPGHFGVLHQSAPSRSTTIWWTTA